MFVLVDIHGKYARMQDGTAYTYGSRHTARLAQRILSVEHQIIYKIVRRPQ